MHTDPDSRWFDRFIVLIIFINCLFLAAVDPLDTNPNSPLNTVRATTRVQPHVRLPLTPARHVTSRWGARDTMQVLDTADLVFQIIYTIEMFFKCAAFGVFCGPRAYVKQTWNIIDGSLVLAGWFGYLPFFQGASLSSIRIVRMLRPLRTVQVVPGLKVRPACTVPHQPTPLWLTRAGVRVLLFSCLSTPCWRRCPNWATCCSCACSCFCCSVLPVRREVNARRRAVPRLTCANVAGGRGAGVQLFGGLMDARCVVPTPTSPVASFVIPDEETTAVRCGRCGCGRAQRGMAVHDTRRVVCCALAVVQPRWRGSAMHANGGGQPDGVCSVRLAAQPGHHTL